MILYFTLDQIMREMTTFVEADAGLAWNQQQFISYWNPGEVVHFHGTLCGETVWIERDLGKQPGAQPMYRVAFGDHPCYPAQVTMDTAIEMIVEHICREDA